MRTRLWTGLLVLTALAALVLSFKREMATMQRLDCNLAAGCSFSLNGKEVSVRTNTPPATARPFKLYVVATASSVRARFDMTAMNMSTPSYSLRHSVGVWSADVVLPICVAGRSDWILRLEVDQASVDIPFTVVS